MAWQATEFSLTWEVPVAPVYACRGEAGVVVVDILVKAMFRFAREFDGVLWLVVSKGALRGICPARC